jgi:hypothetical protein
MILNEFNADRPYTPEGQRIQWKVVGKHSCSIFPEDEIAVVSFYDRSRMITGQVLITNIDRQHIRTTEAQIMDQYDRSYTSITTGDWDQNRIVINQN